MGRGLLVGRDREAGLLLDALGDAQRGVGAVVLVEGEAGSGKTTLVDRTLVHGAHDPSRVLVGVCSPTGSAPLRPWQQALRSRSGVLSAGAAGADGSDGSDGSDGPDAAGALGAAQLRRTAACADALLSDVAADPPMVLVLEDWHWADAASRALLTDVATGVRGVPLLLVVTSRPHAGAAALLRLPTVRQVRLPRLDREAVATWLQASGRPDGPGDVDRVLAVSDGLPLLMAATDDADEGLAAVGASATAGLDPAHLQVLTAAAVVDDVTDEPLLASVTGLPRSAVADALRAARRTGTVVGGAFRHELVREAVAGLGATGAAGLCRAAAEGLERRGDASPFRLVALWARAGDQPPCLAGRARAALDAARSARVALALDDAWAVLDGALGPALLRSDPRLAAEVALEAAQVCFDLGDVHRSIELCETAAGAAARAGRGDLLARAALVCRSVVFPRARDTVQRLAARALDLDPPPVVRSRLLSQLAAVAADDADVPRARDLAARSLHLAESTGDPAALLDAYRAQEAVLVEGPDAGRERLRLGDGTVEQAARLSQPLAAAIGHGWRLVGAVELARPDLVDDAVSRLADLARTGGPYVRWHERRALAAVATLHGDFDTARAASDEALRLAVAAGDPVGAGMTFQLGLELARLRGDAREVAPGSDAALALAPPIPIIQVARAATEVARGAPADAVPYYEQVMAGLDAALGDVRGRGVAFQLPDLAVALGDVDGARRLLAALDVFRDHEGGVGAHTTYFFGSPRRELGRLAALVGRPEEAEAHLRAAVRVDLLLRARPQTCLARLDLARLLLDPGAPDDAERREEGLALARLCAAEAARLDMPGASSAATALLAGPGAGPARGGPGHDEGLTRREDEIAGLVRRGLTNREIADTLVVSERTVETHVSNVLRKLGHRNRREMLAGRPAP